jgi:hypothetical protein
MPYLPQYDNSISYVRAILNNANNYSHIAKYINQSGISSFLIPSQVIAALSLELFFKTLFFIENSTDFKINGRYSHDFFALFQELSNESRVRIQSNFEEAIKNRGMQDINLMEKIGSLKVNLDFSENLKIWFSFQN